MSELWRSIAAINSTQLNLTHELMAKSNVQNDHIIEEEEQVDDHSVNSCDKTQF